MASQLGFNLGRDLSTHEQLLGCQLGVIIVNV
jgi:hypothetical protein